MSSAWAGRDFSEAVPDQSFRLDLLRTYNDATGEIRAGSGDRLLPMGVLPSWDVDACVHEAERLAGLGHRGVNITCDPQDQGSPDLASQAWDSPLGGLHASCTSPSTSTSGPASPP